jgi:LmeA-like phospholipid-binding
VVRAWIAGRIDESLGLEAPPDVDLHGFPFTLQVVRSEFEEVDVEIRDLRARGGLVLDSVFLWLRGLRFPRDRLFGRGPGNIRARGGIGALRITDADLTTHLRGRGLPMEVEFLGPEVRATATVGVAGIDVDPSATANLAVSDGHLVFRPQEIEVGEAVSLPVGLLSFEVPLPQPVEGVTFDRVIVEEGRATVLGRVRNLKIPVRQ